MSPTTKGKKSNSPAEQRKINVVVKTVNQTAGATRLHSGVAYMSWAEDTIARPTIANQALNTLRRLQTSPGFWSTSVCCSSIFTAGSQHHLLHMQRFPAGHAIECRWHEMPFVTGTVIILIVIGITKLNAIDDELEVAGPEWCPALGTDTVRQVPQPVFALSASHRRRRRRVEIGIEDLLTTRSGSCFEKTRTLTHCVPRS